MPDETPKILLAGGGTAGHVEPALAVGRWLAENSPKIRIEFLGTARGLEKDLVPAAGFHLNYIERAPFPRKLNRETVLWPVKFFLSLIQTWRALVDVDLLMGFGGYVCASAYLVARLKRIPIVVHEANAVPGWANKLGVRLGATALIAFESTRKFGGSWSTAQYVGIPLRTEIVEAAQLSIQARHEMRLRKAREWGVSPDRPIILVTGGSLGSQHINKVIEESNELISHYGFQIIHAVGSKNNLPASTNNYKAIAYFHDLPEAYCAADLVICRSGAVTCHELMAIGSYALLVPLSIGNGEQKFNGEPLVQAGAATMVSNSEFTHEWLAAHLLGLISAGKKFNHQEHKPQVPIDAVTKIGELITRLLNGKG